ncbi:unnamed protein product, partial [Iphiclides podalirius]
MGSKKTCLRSDDFLKPKNILKDSLEAPRLFGASDPWEQRERATGDVSACEVTGGGHHRGHTMRILAFQRNKRVGQKLYLSDDAALCQLVSNRVFNKIISHTHPAQTIGEGCARVRSYLRPLQTEQCWGGGECALHNRQPNFALSTLEDNGARQTIGQRRDTVDGRQQCSDGFNQRLPFVDDDQWGMRQWMNTAGSFKYGIV